MFIHWWEEAHVGDHSSSSLWGLPVSGVLLFVSGALLAVAHTYVHVHSNPHTYINIYIYIYTFFVVLILRFLAMFQDSKHLGKDQLKFAKTFNTSIVHTERTMIGTQEDYMAAGHILQSFGQSFSDFESDEKALDAVRHLCRLNQAEHGYEEKQENIDTAYPRFSKFWFVFSKGKEVQQHQDTQKTLSQTTDLKTLAQLESAKVFMEGLGFDDVGETTATIENAKAGELKKSLELLKMT